MGAKANRAFGVEDMGYPEGQSKQECAKIPQTATISTQAVALTDVPHLPDSAGQTNRMRPELLPPPLRGPAVWRAGDWGPQESYTVYLSDRQLAEIEQAATHWLEQGHHLESLTAGSLHLPGLYAELTQWTRRLLHGEGFVLIRGLPVDRWSRPVLATAFYGLGCYLGNPRPQNQAGHLLGHVIDKGLDPSDPHVRLYQTHERQSFHTDSCDIVGLLCLKQAKEGGDSALVSSNTIYNEMRKNTPELAAALFDPIATDRRGETPAGEKPYFEIPVFNWHQAEMSTIYQRQYIDSAQRFPQAMRLTDLHRQALDTFDALANDSSLHIMMRLQEGDMQFVHNHNMLHDRTAFTDWPQPSQRRHLLRLWISSPQARALPPVFAQRYGSVVPGQRGGIDLPRSAWHAPLNP